MTLVGALRSRAAFVLLAMLMLVTYGLLSATRLPSSIYPDVDFPRVVVVVRTGQLPAEQMQTVVTRIVEESVATVPDLQRLRSHTIRGACELSIQFRPGTDMWRAVQLVESHVASIRGELPADAVVEIERVTPTALPILTMNIRGDGIDPRVLHDVGERILRPALARVPGIGTIEVQGGDVREVEVAVHPAALAAIHVTPSDLATTLGESLHVEAVGRSIADYQQWTVLASAVPPTTTELAALPVATGPAGPIALGTVADVFDGAEDRRTSVADAHGEAVVITVSRALGASAPEVARGARDAIAAAAKAFPAGVVVEPVYDQSVLIDDSIAGVRDAILLGIVLSLVVLGGFLRDVRAGAVAAIAVPITLAGTFGLMKLAGQTLNLMSLGGLAIAIGLVIDDAIVVVEAIVLQLEEGANIDVAVETGTRSLFAAVVGTTLTTVLVFAPLAVLSGVIGSFFGALAVTLCASVLLSLVVALTIVPLAAIGVLKARPPKPGTRRVGFIARGFATVTAALVRRPLGAIALVVAVAAAGLVAAGRVDTGFLPAMDEGAIVVDFLAPAGTSLAETNRIAKHLDHILATTPGVIAFTRRTGAEMGPATATQPNRGDMLVRLAPRDQRSSVYTIMDGIRERAERETPELQVELVQVLQDVLDDLSGNPRPLEIKIFGPDRKVLEGLGHTIGARIEKVDGLEDTFDGVEGSVPVVRVDVNADAAARLGTTAARVIDDLAVLLDGRVVGQLLVGDRAIGVRVRGLDSARFDPDAVAHFPLAYGTSHVAVDTVARFSRPALPSVVERENLTQMVAVTAGISHGADLAATTKAATARIADVPIPEGYRVVVDGQLASAKQSRRELGGVFGLGVLLVLGVVVLQLRSLRLALVVLVGIPLALAGAALALWLTHTPLNASSLMGCVLLAGLVVKNGILLLEHARAHVGTSTALDAALIEAAARRLRPIAMTSVATVVGLIPLAIGFGAGSELQRPLAIATIGGLIVATLVTLLVTPALAALVMRHRGP